MAFNLLCQLSHLAANLNPLCRVQPPSQRLSFFSEAVNNLVLLTAEMDEAFAKLSVKRSASPTCACILLGGSLVQSFCQFHSLICCIYQLIHFFVVNCLNLCFPRNCGRYGLSICIDWPRTWRPGTQEADEAPEPVAQEERLQEASLETTKVSVTVTHFCTCPNCETNFLLQ